MKRFAVCVLLLVFVAGLAGCGDEKGTVHGTVMFDGKPVENGSVTFVKTEGGAVREGAIIKDGTFQARMAPGKYKVEVTGKKVLGKKIQKGFDGKDEEVEDNEELFPERYNTATELTAEVIPGKNEVKLELHSKR